MDFLKLCAERYSVRSFADTPIPDDILHQILEAGRLAPTAMNLQPQRIFVIRSEEALAKMRAVKKCYGVNTVLMVCGDTEVACNRPKVDHCMAEMDCAIVTTQMMLQAQELGLGTCWVCWFDTALTKQTFGIPENEEVFALLPLGYPAEVSKPSSMHDSRKPLEETVVRL